MEEINRARQKHWAESETKSKTEDQGIKDIENIR